MSVSRHCAFYKAADQKWYMDLASEEYGGHEDSTTYGPFASKEAAIDFLDDNFSNPGGWSEDGAGTRPVPTASPNGSPLQRPKRHNSMRFSLPRMR